MRKSRLLTISLSLLLTAVISVCGVFAWFVMSDSINSLFFQIAKIDSIVELYKGLDFNRDGTLDRGLYDGEDGSTPIHSLFENLGSDHAIGSALVSLDLQMQMDNLFPTQKQTYRLTITNNSEANNTIRIAFESYLASYYVDQQGTPLYSGEDFDRFIATLKCLSVEVSILQNDGETRDENYESEKFYFADMIFTELEDDRNGYFELLSNFWIDSILASSADNVQDVLITFTFESFDVLTTSKENGGAGLGITQQEYNAFQGQNFILPALVVYLEIPN